MEANLNYIFDNNEIDDETKQILNDYIDGIEERFDKEVREKCARNNDNNDSIDDDNDEELSLDDQIKLIFTSIELLNIMHKNIYNRIDMSKLDNNIKEKIIKYYKDKEDYFESELNKKIVKIVKENLSTNKITFSNKILSLEEIKEKHRHIEIMKDKEIELKKIEIDKLMLEKAKY